MCMVVDVIPGFLLAKKLQLKQKLMKSKGVLPLKPLRKGTLEDYLLASNAIAVDYFEKNKNLLRRLFEYQGIDPDCGPHSTYTYAAFLSLTSQDDEVRALQDNVRWVGGMYLNLEDVSQQGHHAWLEKKVGDEWAPFETIPSMRDLSSVYVPWYTFQMSKQEPNITSEKPGGRFMITAGSIFYP